MTLTIAFNVAVLYLVAANLLLILGYVLMVKHRRRKKERDAREIADLIVAFFRRNDLEAAADCYTVVEGKRFEVAIETEPHKKLRCSYVIEQALIRHVQRTTGKRLERVFWRFPMAQKSVERRAEVAGQAPTDAYLADGYEQALSTYPVGEESWEKFEAAQRQEQAAQAAGS